MHVSCPPDAYVKVCLMIQNKAVKTKKTEVAKKTSQPSFNESFTFKLPVSGLDTASVNLTLLQHLSGHKELRNENGSGFQGTDMTCVIPVAQWDSDRQ
ncbi:hypothetical protein ACOMHN_005261 [Nucella lapillus]